MLDWNQEIFGFFSFDLIWLGIPYEYKEVDLAKGEQYSPGEFRAQWYICSALGTKLNSG